MYNLKSHKAFGKVGEFRTTLRPHRAEVFALLPEEAPQLELRLETQKIQPGDVVKGTIAVPGALGKHAIRILATTSDGEPAPWLERKLIVDGEGVSISLPFAYNDPSGEWIVRVLDLYTGQGTSKRITIE